NHRRKEEHDEERDTFGPPGEAAARQGRDERPEKRGHRNEGAERLPPASPYQRDHAAEVEHQEGEDSEHAAGRRGDRAARVGEIVQEPLGAAPSSTPSHTRLLAGEPRSDRLGGGEALRGFEPGVIYELSR